MPMTMMMSPQQQQWRRPRPSRRKRHHHLSEAAATATTPMNDDADDDLRKEDPLEGIIVSDDDDERGGWSFRSTSEELESNQNDDHNDDDDDLEDPAFVAVDKIDNHPETSGESNSHNGGTTTGSTYNTASLHYSSRRFVDLEAASTTSSSSPPVAVRSALCCFKMVPEDYSVADLNQNSNNSNQFKREQKKSPEDQVKQRGASSAAENGAPPPPPPPPPLPKDIIVKTKEPKKTTRKHESRGTLQDSSTRATSTATTSMSTGRRHPRKKQPKDEGYVSFSCRMLFFYVITLICLCSVVSYYSVEYALDDEDHDSLWSLFRNKGKQPSAAAEEEPPPQAQDTDNNTPSITSVTPKEDEDDNASDNNNDKEIDEQPEIQGEQELEEEDLRDSILSDFCMGQGVVFDFSIEFDDAPQDVGIYLRLQQQQKEQRHHHHHQKTPAPPSLWKYDPGSFSSTTTTATTTHSQGRNTFQVCVSRFVALEFEIRDTSQNGLVSDEQNKHNHRHNSNRPFGNWQVRYQDHLVASYHGDCNDIDNDNKKGATSECGNYCACVYQLSLDPEKITGECRNTNCDV